MSFPPYVWFFALGEFVKKCQERLERLTNRCGTGASRVRPAEKRLATSDANAGQGLARMQETSLGPRPVLRKLASVVPIAWAISAAGSRGAAQERPRTSAKRRWPQNAGAALMALVGTLSCFRARLRADNRRWGSRGSGSALAGRGALGSRTLARACPATYRLLGHR